MAGTLKEKQLAERVYSKLQGLECPLVEGLFLQDADSMRDLLCTTSLHRTDILTWICGSCSPSLKKKLFTLRSTQADILIQEIARFGHEMMLCQPDDLDLIKGVAPPLRQLHFMEQLLALVPDKQRESADVGVGEVLVRGEEFLGELMSDPSMLAALLNPSCSPWSADLRELLRKRAPKGKRGQSRAVCGKPAEDAVVEASTLLQSTQCVLEDLRKECEFLQSEAAVSPMPRLSPCALRLAISDLSQLMTAFSQSFNTEFKGYCQRGPPGLSPNSHCFRTVHQLLLSCSQELQALQQVSDTSSAVSATVKNIQTDRKYWGDGQKYTLPAKLEVLKKKYAEFLSLYPA